jgi:hypothetical protein
VRGRDLLAAREERVVAGEAFGRHRELQGSRVAVVAMRQRAVQVVGNAGALGQRHHLVELVLVDAGERGLEDDRYAVALQGEDAPPERVEGSGRRGGAVVRLGSGTVQAQLDGHRPQLCEAARHFLRDERAVREEPKRHGTRANGRHDLEGLRVGQRLSAGQRHVQRPQLAQVVDDGRPLVAVEAAPVVVARVVAEHAPPVARVRQLEERGQRLGPTQSALLEDRARARRRH